PGKRGGFDRYWRWLQEPVAALRNGERGAGRGTFPAPEVILDQPAHLSDSYVGDAAAKLDLYRRLGRAEQPCEIQAVREELRDRFGPLPDEAQRLLLVSELRALGAQAGLEMVLVKGDEARLTFRREAQPRLARLTVALDAVQFEAEVRRSVPLSLRLRRLGGEAIGPGLVRALTAVLQDSHAYRRRHATVGSGGGDAGLGGVQSAAGCAFGASPGGGDGRWAVADGDAVGACGRLDAERPA